MNNQTKEQRMSKIIARGEFSDHSHVVCGDAIVKRENGNILLEVGNEGAVLRHIIESSYVETGEEVWTEEHKDIDLSMLPEQVRHGDVMLELVGKRTYKYIPQMVFDPLNQRIQNARD